MGFDEQDYQRIIDSNFQARKGEMFFTRDKLYKMAGNSIVVNVLEEIFKQLIYIDKNILQDEKVKKFSEIEEAFKIVTKMNNEAMRKVIFN